MLIEIPSSLAGYIDSALVRLRGQFQGVSFERTSMGIVAYSGELPAPEQIRSAVLHAVYREKIYTETLPLREALLNAVLR